MLSIALALLIWFWDLSLLLPSYQLADILPFQSKNLTASISTDSISARVSPKIITVFFGIHIFKRFEYSIVFLITGFTTLTIKSVLLYRISYDVRTRFVAQLYVYCCSGMFCSSSDKYHGNFLTAFLFVCFQNFV